jgi:hypothetical protein
MSDVWAKLNDRQRVYLRALYDCDQATEAERRERAARGQWNRMPASEWRWQTIPDDDASERAKEHQRVAHGRHSQHQLEHKVSR